MMKQKLTNNQLQLMADLEAVKEALFKPLSREEIFEATKVKDLVYKLQQWVKHGDLYSKKSSETTDGRISIYFTDDDFSVQPKLKTIVNGNSTVYMLTNYSRPTRQERKSPRVHISGAQAYANHG